MFHDHTQQLRADQGLFHAPIVQPNREVAPGLDDPIRFCEGHTNPVLEADHLGMSKDVLQPLGTDTHDESEPIPQEHHVGSRGTVGPTQASPISGLRLMEYANSRAGDAEEGR